MIVSEIDAKRVFVRGDKVCLSLEGLRAGIWTNVDAPSEGVVAGFGRESKFHVRILLKGYKKPQTFAWWFWERAAAVRGK